MLQLAALSAIGFNADLKGYDERKVNQEKNKMSVINAVRNEITLLNFVRVNQNRKYQKYMLNLLVEP